VKGVRQARKRQGRRARLGLQRFRSTLTAFVTALALLVQLAAVADHGAFAAPGPEGVAAELRATFGDHVVLCIHEDGAPDTPASPAGHCDCPLCQFAGQMASLLVPPSPTLPLRFGPQSETLTVAFASSAPKLRPTGLAQPRAPPLEA
jgi:hypothetical protein